MKDDVLEPCRLDECPPGLFMFGDMLGFRSEYSTQVRKTVAENPDGPIYQPDAYVVESGEYFWGGASDTATRSALIVQPLEIPNNPTSSDVVDWRSLAIKLAIREANYRLVHDLHGDGSAEAGRAWDLMRRAGEKVSEAALQVRADAVGNIRQAPPMTHVAQHIADEIEETGEWISRLEKAAIYLDEGSHLSALAALRQVIADMNYSLNARSST